MTASPEEPETEAARDTRACGSTTYGDGSIHRIRVGTQGWAYDAWEDLFYPPGTRSEDRLSTYGRAFDVVEVNSTFYGAPPAERFEQWRRATPDGFRFSVKVPGEITHEARLEGHPRRLEEFCRRAGRLGEKLGPVLVQLPPDFGPEEGGEPLASFLEARPPGPDFAVEFRDPTWLSEEVLGLLHRQDVSLAVSQGQWLRARPALRAARVAPGPMLYVRWMGKDRPDSPPPEGESLLERSGEREAWSRVLLEAAEVKEAVYGFYNDDYEGHAPESARRTRRRLGQSVVEPSDLSEQGELFG